MENRINVLELLKDCPKGMELDCTMYDEVEFMEVDTSSDTIILRVGNKFIRRLNKYGQDDIVDYAKCVIFPKGKTTWEGFVPPCKFKDGDWITNGDYTWQVISHDNFDYTLRNQYGEYIDDTIDYVNKAFHLWTIEDAKDGDVLVCDIDKAEIGGDVEKLPNIVSTIFIFRNVITSRDYIHSYCHLYDRRFLGLQRTMYYNSFVYNIHPATKEQHDFLFKEIRDAGYKWNAKTLEKLIEPKFKVGDRIGHKTADDDNIYEISKVYDDSYGLVDFTCKLDMKYQDNYELVPNKFDIRNLKEFDKVLVRDYDKDKWNIDFFSYYRDSGDYQCMTFVKNQCIPYEGNEHLLGKTDNCNEYYKTWK